MSIHIDNVSQTGNICKIFMYVLYTYFLLFLDFPHIHNA